MIIYEKEKKLNINFENSTEKQPDIVLEKKDGKTEIIVNGNNNTLPKTTSEDVGKAVVVDEDGGYTLGLSGGGSISSVNGKTGSVVLDAEDVGAIESPESPVSGQFLVYDGDKWTAQTVETWQGGSY